MRSPLDFANFTNFRQHPTQRAYLVYFFTDVSMANYFEELLIEAEIPYERGVEDDGIKRYLFGIHKKYESDTSRLNSEAIGKYRQKFIPTAGFRYFVLGFVALAIFLAIMGYLKQQL